MELWLPDQATLLPVTGGLRLDWATSPVPVRWVTPAEAEAAQGNDVIVLASPLARVASRGGHVVIGDICVASEPRGAVALASAQRPDELGEVEIDARDASLAAEALTGILRVLHFGAGGFWRMARTPAPGAVARLVDGDAAVALLLASEAAATTQAKLRVAAERAGLASMTDEDEEDEAPAAPLSDGVVEDLARAWYVLTGLPWVSHLLFAPSTLLEREPDLLAAVVDTLRASIQQGHEQEAALIAEASARLGLPTRPLRGLLRLQRHRLGAPEQQALSTFFARAERYTVLAPPTPPRIMMVTSDT